jgi:hypothetical protein
MTANCIGMLLSIICGVVILCNYSDWYPTDVEVTWDYAFLNGLLTGSFYPVVILGIVLIIVVCVFEESFNPIFTILFFCYVFDISLTSNATHIPNEYSIVFWSTNIITGIFFTYASLTQIQSKFQKKYLKYDAKINQESCSNMKITKIKDSIISFYIAAVLGYGKSQYQLGRRLLILSIYDDTKLGLYFGIEGERWILKAEDKGICHKQQAQIHIGYFGMAVVSMIKLFTSVMKLTLPFWGTIMCILFCIIVIQHLF